MVDDGGANRDAEPRGPVGVDVSEGTRVDATRALLEDARIAMVLAFGAPVIDAHGCMAAKSSARAED